jgi:hypothetical protein
MEAILKIAGAIVATYFITSFGMLYAFCPINDKETSTLHRAITLVVALVALYFVWS